MTRRLVHLTMTIALVVGAGVAAAADLQDHDSGYLWRAATFNNLIAQ